MVDNPLIINAFRINIERALMLTFSFCSRVIVLYPDIKSGYAVTKKPIPIIDNPKKITNISILLCI